MSNSTFTKIAQNDKPLYGPRKLILCGFSTEAARSNFLKVMQMAGVEDVPTVWAGKINAENILSDLMAMPDKTGWENDSDLPRAVIAGGITQKELPALMTASRRAGMGKSLWAVLTPISENWTLMKLLTELESERCAMQEKMKNKKS